MNHTRPLFVVSMVLLILLAAAAVPRQLIL